MEEMMSNENGAAGSEVVVRKESPLTRVVRSVFRLVMILMIGIALGVGIYFGTRALYRNYVEPMQASLQRMAEIEEALAQDKVLARTQAEQTGERLAEIDGRLAEQSEAMAILVVEIDSVQNGLEEQDNRIDQLRTMVNRIETLSSDLKATADQVEGLETALLEIELPAQRISKQINLIQAMTLLSKAHLWLAEDNLGLAAEEIVAARDILAFMPESDSPEENALVDQIIDRLSLALADVRTTPNAAADELEIAWKLMLEATELEISTPDFDVDEKSPKETPDES
jgi:chromosome segregation ATPase